MLGIVSDSEFELEIDKLNGNTPSGSVIDLQKGRGKGNVATPEVIQKIIGETAIEEGNETARALTRALGISDSSLSAYKHGASSTASYDSPKAELKNHTDGIRDKIISRSKSRLLSAITNITKEKLEGAKARELAGIAKDLSGVVKNLEPEKQEEKNDRPFVVFAPIFKDERSFEVIQAKE